MNNSEFITTLLNSCLETHHDIINNFFKKKENIIYFFKSCKEQNIIINFNTSNTLSYIFNFWFSNISKNYKTIFLSSLISVIFEQELVNINYDMCIMTFELILRNINKDNENILVQSIQDSFIKSIDMFQFIKRYSNINWNEQGIYSKINILELLCFNLLEEINDIELIKNINIINFLIINGYYQTNNYNIKYILAQIFINKNIIIIKEIIKNIFYKIEQDLSEWIDTVNMFEQLKVCSFNFNSIQEFIFLMKSITNKNILFNTDIKYKSILAYSNKITLNRLLCSEDIPSYLKLDYADIPYIIVLIRKDKYTGYYVNNAFYNIYNLEDSTNKFEHQFIPTNFKFITELFPFSDELLINYCKKSYKEFEKITQHKIPQDLCKNIFDYICDIPTRELI